MNVNFVRPRPKQLDGSSHPAVTLAALRRTPWQVSVICIAFLYILLKGDGQQYIYKKAVCGSAVFSDNIDSMVITWQPEQAAHPES